MKKNIESEIFQAIKNMRIQGASEISLYALHHLKQFAKRKGFGKAFTEEADKLASIRPTAVHLYNSVSELKQDASMKKIDTLIKQIKSSKKRIAKNSSKIFRRKSIVLTHCHSHEVIEVLKYNKKKIKKVIVTETSPRKQGLLTAHDLKKAGIPFSFIVDSAAGFYMKTADMVIVGSDAIRREGIINKIGTLPIAIIASEFDKPFYVITDSLKIDKRKKLVIEMRNGSEISNKFKKQCLNPAFDITGFKYIKAVITERGILKPGELLRMII